MQEETLFMKTMLGLKNYNICFNPEARSKEQQGENLSIRQ